MILIRYPLFFLLLLFAGSILRAGETIRTITAVRELSREEASTNKPVLIRGIVTQGVPANMHGIVFQQDQAGIFVRLPQNNPPAQPFPPLPPGHGYLIEVEGVTDPGNFAPLIIASAVRILGTAPQPPPLHTTIGEMMTGALDCRRILVTGVVRSVTATPSDTRRLEIATRGGTFLAWADQPIIPDADKLVDAEVRVTGVCGAYYNDRRELLGVSLKIQNSADLEVLKSPPADPFEIPLTPFNLLQPFSPKGTSLHRHRIIGTVTLSSPGNFCYIQEKGRGVRINTASKTLLTPGERVEVSGFVEVRKQYAELIEAVVKRIGPGTLEKPIPVLETSQAVNPNSWPIAATLDGVLVFITGNLHNVETLVDGNIQLYLDCRGVIVTALLPKPSEPLNEESLRLGSTLSISGVCAVDHLGRPPAQDFPRPVSFQLLMRTPADIKVIHLASWWSPDRLRFALAAGAITFAAALAWAVTLRLRVARRSRELAQIGRAHV